MTPREFRQEKEFEFDHFIELTSTGISPNHVNIELFAHEYHKAKLNLLTIPDVVNCNCDESKQLEEGFEINHLINDTYQVVGKDSSTVWKQGTMEECNDWVML
jgi:hypothetical protein